MTLDSTTQRISRLTPLSAILSLIDARIRPVAAQASSLEAAREATLAEDVFAPICPPSAIALRDGYPVDSTAVADGGPYAPVALPLMTRRIDVGEPLPSGTDAVMPVDAVVLRGPRAEAVSPIAAGEGALPAGGDARPQEPLLRAGQRLRPLDLAVMRAVGIHELTIRRPKIRVVWGGVGRSPMIEAAMATVMRVAGKAGAVVTGQSATLELALDDPETDAVIAVGGTGSGQNDTAVHTLAHHGNVEAHGIAISPGETAAFGFADTRPVLLIPGRLDAALTLWLLVGRHLVAKLAGAKVEEVLSPMPLRRKVSSSISLVELIPVSCVGGMAEPLASGYLSLQSLSRSDGWIVVPAESEGFAAGTPVAVRPWP